MNKFKSRKFWVAIGVILSALLSKYAGLDIDPVTLAGVALTASAYVIGQGIVDKSVVTAQVQGAYDVGKAQLEAYAVGLEQQLQEVTNSLEIQKAATQLTLVPDEE